MYSHVQLSAAPLLCTLQQHHTVHITSSAPMDHQRYVPAQYVTGGNSPNDEEDWLLVAVQMMKKTGCL